jgi:hypothetical protein
MPVPVTKPNKPLFISAFPHQIKVFFFRFHSIEKKNRFLIKDIETCKHIFFCSYQMMMNKQILIFEIKKKEKKN